MKSILIIETPKRCYDCPLFTSIDDDDNDDCEYGFCDDRNILKQKEAQEKIRFDRKPIWCPIKPLPQKKETRYAMQYRGLAEEYRKEGWNECLDVIMGEEK